jgi:hypothetical protein
MRNRYQERAKHTFRTVLRHIKDPELREEMHDGLDDLKRADSLWNQWIQEGKMIGVRNPAFDGDMVGYPEDDFDKSDDEDEESNKK